MIGRKLLNPAVHVNPSFQSPQLVILTSTGGLGAAVTGNTYLYINLFSYCLKESNTFELKIPQMISSKCWRERKRKTECRNAHLEFSDTNPGAKVLQMFSSSNEILCSCLEHYVYYEASIY